MSNTPEGRTQEMELLSLTLFMMYTD